MTIDKHFKVVGTFAKGIMVKQTGTLEVNEKCDWANAEL